MKALRQLQEEFQAYLLDGMPAVAESVLDAPPLGASARLAVYADAYRLRLIEALGKDFPVLRTRLGEEAFIAMAHAYITAFPSRHQSLRWFGRHLAGFLRDTPPYATQTLLAEMADFEWTQGEVFDSPDAATISIETIAAIPPERWAELRFDLHPALRRLLLHWNAPALWQAVHAQQPPPAAERAETATQWLLWRRELLIYWRSLDADEAAALDLCQIGGSFGELCELLSVRIGEADAPMRASSLLKQWVTDGLVEQVCLERRR